MVFSSLIFLWIFLPAVFILSRINRSIPYQNILLLIVSLVFYAWGEPVYILLLLFSILFNWAAGLLMDKAKGSKKMVLATAVVVNLAVLGFFKYADFAVATVNRIPGVDLPLPGISLPIGISFFTFQALSYVIDLYRGKYKAQKSLFRLALYISFFPQLIAGPIVRYEDVARQLEKRTMTPEKTVEGIRRFAYGLAKKVLIANIVASVAERLFAPGAAGMTTPMVWIAAVAYALQVYYDFSGYSDMAIGMGKIFGFDFRENFNLPFVSKSIGEVWRRWHISLGEWFKEYLYIPLGGNRKGELRSCINLMITFAMTGLWHGASWNFVGWGVYQGIFIILERLGLKKLLKKNDVLAVIYSDIVFAVSIILFHEISMRSTLDIWLVMFGIRQGTPLQPLALMISPLELCVFIAGILGCGVIQGIGGLKENKLSRIWKGSFLEVLFLSVAMFLSITFLSTDAYNPFIYFRF